MYFLHTTTILCDLNFILLIHVDCILSYVPIHIYIASTHLHVLGTRLQVCMYDVVGSYACMMGVRDVYDVCVVQGCIP